MQNPMTSTKSKAFLFIELPSFLSCLLEIGRHLVVEVVGQCEIAREIDFDSVAFADGHRWHDVQELLEDLCGRLRCASRESLTHQVRAGRGEGACGPGLRDGPEATNGQRYPKDAEIVVIDLIPQPGVADLVEPLELIEADGISVRHKHAVKQNGQTCGWRIVIPPIIPHDSPRC